MDITVLKLEFPEAEFNAPFASGRGGDADDRPIETASRSRSKIGAVVAVFAVVVIATYLLRRRSADRSDEPTVDALTA